MIIISQIKPNPEKVDASGTNLGPNSQSRAAKCPSPRGTFLLMTIAFSNVSFKGDWPFLHPYYRSQY